MRGAIRACSACVVVLALLATSAAADLPEVRHSGVLRVLVMENDQRSGFFSLADARHPGFDREILERFAEFERVRLQTVAVSLWKGLIPALSEGRGEVIAGRFTATNTRRALVDFTVEVFPTRLIIVTRKPHRTVWNLQELRGEKVGVVKGASGGEAVRAAGLFPTLVDDTIPAGGLPDALKRGRITAAVFGVESAILLGREDDAIQLGMFLGPPSSLAYAVRKDCPQLLEALNSYIRNVRRTSTWNRLVVEYFGEAALDILKKARPRADELPDPER